MQNISRLPVPLVALSAALLGAVASADDWPQFRKDPQRSGASNDSLKLPLTPVWTIGDCNSPVIWKGRLYAVVTTVRTMRWVVCADARTGVELWRRQLTGVGDRPDWVEGLGVSQSGLVFVSDWEPLSHTVRFLVHDGERSRQQSSTHRHSRIRVFNALDGRPVGMHPPPALEQEPGNSIDLTHSGNGQFVRGILTSLHATLGPPLLLGDQLLATTIRDHFVMWSPGGAASYARLGHGLRHSSTDQLFPGVWFGSYPPVAAGAGTVVGGAWHAEGGQSRADFLALLQGTGGAQWHQDFAIQLGYPASDNGKLFVPYGKGPVTLGVLGIDAGTGATAWRFQPTGQTPDPHNVVSLPAWANQGMVAAHNQRVFTCIGANAIALDQSTGAPLWQTTVFPGGRGRFAAVSRDHLFVTGTLEAPADGNSKHIPALVAIRLTSGKPEWRVPLSAVGPLLIGRGLLFHLDRSGEMLKSLPLTTALTAYAPAERTFHLAVDSSRKEDYRTELGGPLPAPDAANQNPEVPVQPQAPAPGGEAEKLPGVADASLLRLRWGTGVKSLLEQVEARRAATTGMPLTLSLEWLDARRAKRLGANPDTPWTDAEIAAFAETCGKLAEAAAPDYFDVAPEVNVYLARHPEQQERVAQLVRAARAAIRKASERTRVLVSLNRELLANRYGQGPELSFGELPKRKAPELLLPLHLAREVDALGLTSRPLCGFRVPNDLPMDWFLGLREQLGEKPVLITGLYVPGTANPLGEAVQGALVRRLLQACYWLDAPLVAYPEVDAPQPAGDKAGTLATYALRTGDRVRLALGPWKEALAWKKVDRLSAGQGLDPQ